MSPGPKSTARIAIVGCVHGQLDVMYKELMKLKPRPELVLVCGDVQAVRDESDLKTMSVPAKHLKMGDFKDYYAGKKQAPLLTAVIGGNHESSKFFRELPSGGWLAKNIYYFGDAGHISYKGIQIAGISGIFYDKHYLWPRNEKFPFKGESKYSAYHQRQSDVKKLWDLGPNKIDIFLSHDWPNTIERFASDAGRKLLFRLKPRFQKDSENARLGSPPLFELLTHLQPKYWFAAHMHIKFEVEFEHGSVLGHKTKFMALDKVKTQRPWWYHVEDFDIRSNDGLVVNEL